MLGDFNLTGQRKRALVDGSETVIFRSMNELYKYFVIQNIM